MRFPPEHKSVRTSSKGLFSFIDMYIRLTAKTQVSWKAASNSLSNHSENNNEAKALDLARTRNPNTRTGAIVKTASADCCSC